MPIYEYRCSHCGHEFEEWQKISDAPVKVCPSCKARKVERLISATSFQLKGSGWYATDYGRGSSGGGGKKKPSSGEGSSGSGSSDSGSKPASGASSGGTGSSSKASASQAAAAA